MSRAPKYPNIIVILARSINKVASNLVVSSSSTNYFICKQLLCFGSRFGFHT